LQNYLKVILKRFIIKNIYIFAGMKTKHSLLLKSFIALTITFVVAACNRESGKKISQDSSNQSGVISLTSQDFREKVWDYKEHPNEWVFKSQRPAVIDFYADWCAPCKTAAPILEELAEKYKDKVDFFRVNTDNEQELAQLFGIRTIPSFLWIPAQGEPQMTSGIAPGVDATRKLFTDMIENHCLGKFSEEEIKIE
jgi:thioredoxin